MIAEAVLVAIVASITFGWSTAAMHSTAFSAPDHTGRLRELLGHVITQRRWVSGLAASVTGLVLHAFALSIGSIVVVQPIIATGLLWSLGFGELFQHRRPPRTMIGWAIFMAAGLALFFAFDVSTQGRATPYSSQAALLLAVGAAFIGGGWLLSRRGSNRRSGLFLGAAAGVVFGLIAGTLKATTASAHDGALLTSWPLYVLLALGATGFVLNQAAYSRVPLAQSLPILNIVNPVTALIFGFVAFDERPSGSAWEFTVQSIGLVITLLGVFMLAKVEAQELAPH